MADIVAEIDALIDEQLAAGEPETGFNYGDPTYPKCWHCGRHWHGLPITQRIDAMYRVGQFDEDYRVDTDDSRALCRGSDFIGPMPPEQPTSSWSVFIDVITAHVTEMIATVTGIPDMRVRFATESILPDTWHDHIVSLPPNPFWTTSSGRERWWRTTLPDDARITENSDDWSYTIHVGAASYEVPGADFYLRERVGVDVCAEVAPNIGGTWEPITAPGVTTHPDAPPRHRSRIFSYGSPFRPVGALPAAPAPDSTGIRCGFDGASEAGRGMVVYTVDGTGHTRAATVSNIEHDEDTGQTTITAHRHPGFGFGFGGGLPVFAREYTGLDFDPFNPDSVAAAGFAPVGTFTTTEEGSGGWADIGASISGDTPA